jgi:regulator of nonsense transcripts 2
LTSLSELLCLPLPQLPTDSQKSDSILIGTNNVNHLGEDSDEALLNTKGKWEDDEERRFFEDVQDLKDFVPKSVLGIEGDEAGKKKKDPEREKLEQEKAVEEAKKLEEELEVLKSRAENGENGRAINGLAEMADNDPLRDEEES